jgi:phage/plasmid-like protein (TIGR03299 family)
MAHEITNTDSLFVTRQVAWHGLGTVLQDNPTSDEALKAAGLDWRVAQSPCCYFAGETLHTDDRYVVNYRDDNGQLLGVVSPYYKIVQNSDAFSFADYLLGEGVRYETAGSIRGGKLVWILAKMPEQKILGDLYNPYLLLVNGHDGRTPVSACMTPVRVVCNNTINLALNTARLRWSFCHHSNIMTKITEAQWTLLLANRYMGALGVEAERLAAIKISQTELQEYVTKLFPAKEGKAANANQLLRIERFRECYESFDLDNVRGTAYGFLMAVSDYTSHIKFKTKNEQQQRESHFVRTVMQSSDLISNAVALFAAV